jgi:hypothetical protein
MNDPAKAKKIDWRFLTATSPAGRGAEADTDIFPADSTKLAPPGLFSSNSDAETAPAEFNFITLVSAVLQPQYNTEENRQEGWKFRERIDHSSKEALSLFTKYLFFCPHYHSHTLINMRPYNALYLTLPSFFSSFLPLFHISISPLSSPLLSQCTGHGHGR